jgi:hypothetical protein
MKKFLPPSFPYSASLSQFLASGYSSKLHQVEEEFKIGRADL